MEGLTDGQPNVQTSCTDGQTDEWTDRRWYKQVYKQADSECTDGKMTRYTDNKINRQTYYHTDGRHG